MSASNSELSELKSAVVKPPDGDVTSCTMMPCAPIAFTTARWCVKSVQTLSDVALGTLYDRVSPTDGRETAREMRAAPPVRDRFSMLLEAARRHAGSFRCKARLSRARNLPSAMLENRLALARAPAMRCCDRRRSLSTRATSPE